MLKVINYGMYDYIEIWWKRINKATKEFWWTYETLKCQNFITFEQVLNNKPSVNGFKLRKVDNIDDEEEMRIEFIH